MSDKHDNGGTAFPTPSTHWPNSGEIREYGLPGMTLLDYFAGQALAGNMRTLDFTRPEATARGAYVIAAAMVAEKRRREGNHE